MKILIERDTQTNDVHIEDDSDENDHNNNNDYNLSESSRMDK